MDFAEIWLKNSGCNKIDSQIKFQDDVIEKITIINGGEEIYRPQTFKVTLLTCHKESMQFEI